MSAFSHYCWIYAPSPLSPSGCRSVDDTIVPKLSPKSRIHSVILIQPLATATAYATGSARERWYNRRYSDTCHLPDQTSRLEIPALGSEDAGSGFSLLLIGRQMRMVADWQIPLSAARFHRHLTVGSGANVRITSPRQSPC
ncbi:hypothetical protein KCP78_07775 [Salmonella enterica subsp. enterica]|nr:hypothetical protein KCP78_07775 [Salmonella enterica subsp. enterica]